MRKRKPMKFVLSLLAVSTSLVVLPSVMAQVERARRPARTQKRAVPRNGGICGGVIVVPVARPQGPVQRGGAFAIVPTFGAGVTAARQVVIQQAINEWQSIIETAGVNPNNYPITFSYEPLAGSQTLAETATFVFFDNGDLGNAEIRIDPGFTWFEDPTPADDSEFAGGGPPGFDLLTVVRHEIGHAVGWVGRFSQRVAIHMNGSDCCVVHAAPGCNDPGCQAAVCAIDPFCCNTSWDGQCVGEAEDLCGCAIFDPGRLNIASVDDGTHTDAFEHPGNLMNPILNPGVREALTLYPDAALPARAFFYTLPMRFGDPDQVGPETGSVNEPWNTMSEAFGQTPAGIPILLSSGTYNEPGPITRSTPTTLSVASGATATISPP